MPTRTHDTANLSISHTSHCMYLGSLGAVLLLHGLVLWATLHTSDVRSAVTSGITENNTLTAALIPRSSPAPLRQTVITESRTPEHKIDHKLEDTPARMPPPRPTNNVRKVQHAPAHQPKHPPARASDASSDTHPASHSGSEPQTSHPYARHAGVSVMQAGHHCPKPEYPRISRRLMEQGVVTLRFLLGRDGEVLQSEIEQTSGFSRLDRAARNALGRCQFRSAASERASTPVWALIHYSWQLK